ncbi:unnamed protein product [Cunninghamella echinulata]
MNSEAMVSVNKMTNKKRKNSMEEEENDINLPFNTTKRVHTGYDSPESMLIDEQKQQQEEVIENISSITPNYFNPLNQHELVSFMQPPPRSTTPPLSMTLAHYDEASGGYTSSMVKSTNEVSSSICTAMTPAYRSPMERFGSCLI